MSQGALLALLSDHPLTQKELSQKLHIERGVLSHRLNSLMRKGLIERKTLEIRYRPFGYVRVVGSDRPAVVRWPKY